MYTARDLDNLLGPDDHVTDSLVCLRATQNLFHNKRKGGKLVLLMCVIMSVGKVILLQFR